ncbi:sugar phosphate isomerase/epimerase [Pseudomonas sp. SWRI59]|uniref:sugar phosphate isomerase/epimerase family protein n=1 Tax=unclassified Pseudomonas TaxID=196821 RepID=UPI001648EBDE|nr:MULTISPECIES: sugar phosphate isomerase/epimerase [unclassified Pseudomonas]MBC3504006.1 sugar phosphate isomerase/epimerase [Pseudomonas sp. SWRI59]MBC3506955.1 sugar phosphate isomerase/epimerase [Pseudomonas sp. SWRI68]
MSGLGVAHLTALDLAPAVLVREARRAGFSSVGLRLHPVLPGALAYPEAAGSQALRELKAVMAGEGVRVADIEFVSLTPEVVVADYEPLLAAGAELGAVSLTVSGDDADFARLTGHFAALCVLARGYGLRVDLEFMRWRPVATVQQAYSVVAGAGQGNSGVLVDALHLFRAGGQVADLAHMDPRYLQAVQLCDAPLQAPPESGIIQEARQGRQLPGDGQLPLVQLLAALPKGVSLSVEVPSAQLHGAQRLTAAARVTQAWLSAQAVAQA